MNAVSNTVIIFVAAICTTGVFALAGVLIGARIVMKALEQRNKISKVKTETHS